MTDRNERRPGNADKTVRDIRRATRRKFSAEEKIRIVLEGLRGEETIAEWFATTWQAQIVINQWLRKYNHVRSHEALSTRVPVPEIIQRTAN